MSRPQEPIETRMERYTDKSGDCWLWTGALGAGYGRIRQSGYPRKMLLAHRVAFELANGAIPVDLVIDHMCHNAACVNPAHLRAVTVKQNVENQAGPHKNNKSGYLGVYEQIPGRFRGRVRTKGKYYYTGAYSSPEPAAEAVKQLRLRLFTHNDLDRLPA